MGDEYISSGSEGDQDSEENSDEEYESEVASDQLSYIDSEYADGRREEGGESSTKKRRNHEETVVGLEEEERFNALRFIALTLKDIKHLKLGKH